MAAAHLTISRAPLAKHRASSEACAWRLTGSAAQTAAHWAAVCQWLASNGLKRLSQPTAHEAAYLAFHCHLGPIDCLRWLYIH